MNTLDAISWLYTNSQGVIYRWNAVTEESTLHDTDFLYAFGDQCDG